MTTHTLGLEHCASFAKQAGSGAHLRHKEKEGFLHRQTRGWRMVSFLLLYLAPICSFDKLADTKCLFKGIVHPRWYTVIFYTLVSFQTCMTFKCATQKKIFWKMPLCFLSMQWKSVGSKMCWTLLTFNKCTQGKKGTEAVTRVVHFQTIHLCT